MVVGFADPVVIPKVLAIGAVLWRTDGIGPTLRYFSTRKITAVRDAKDAAPIERRAVVDEELGSAKRLPGRIR
jgi:hypothetical protein